MRSGVRAGEPNTTRLTPQHWTDAAIEVLIDSGVDSVRVDVLARRLGVTRGSFYWHFSDRSELLVRMLDAWQVRATEQVIVRFRAEHRDPRATLRALLRLPLRGRAAQRGARIELAVRAWARRDVMARRALARIDARRARYIADCFVAMGMTASQAHARAYLVYATMSAEAMLQPIGTRSGQIKRRELIERLLIPKVG